MFGSVQMSRLLVFDDQIAVSVGRGVVEKNEHNKQRIAQLLDLAKRARRLSRTITDERTTSILSRAADDFERQARGLQGHRGPALSGSPH